MSSVEISIITTLPGFQTYQVTPFNTDYTSAVKCVKFILGEKCCMWRNRPD